MGKRKRGKEYKGKDTKDSLKSKIYVFCEGDTEEIYLKHFSNRTYNVEIVPVDPEHTDALGIVKFAKSYIDNVELDIELGDRGYCVFDSDPASNPNINEAFSILENVKHKGLYCIFSNPCFEVWFSLHFGNAPYGKTAKQMKQYVKDKLKKDFPEYCETTDVYEYLLPYQHEASVKAERLAISQSKVHEKVYSHECNPYTNMHMFIAYMNELKQKNSLSFSVEKYTEIGYHNKQ